MYTKNCPDSANGNSIGILRGETQKKRVIIPGGITSFQDPTQSENDK